MKEIAEKTQAGDNTKLMVIFCSQSPKHSKLFALWLSEKASQIKFPVFE
jgi:hypothetical protein